MAHGGRAGAVLRRRRGGAEGGLARRRPHPAGDPARTHGALRTAAGGKDPDDLVKAEGPDAFRAVLAEARPLADLLWMRETSGGVFDTPERRAELEKTLRELAGRIQDESVRFHYNQEMRERVQSFFGAQRGGGRQQGFGKGERRGGGQWSRGGAQQRSAISESLGRSALVRRAGEAMPVREASIVVALVNHPALIDENFEHVEFLDLASGDLRRLHAALLDALAHDERTTTRNRHRRRSSGPVAAISGSGRWR